MSSYPRAPRQWRSANQHRGQPGGRSSLAQVLLRAGVYLGAFLPIILIYGTKERALIIAPPIALIGALTTLFLLQPLDLERHRRLLYAGSVGLVLGELTWALGYWAVPAVVGGAAIWLALYVLSGLAEHAAAGTLTRRITAEYGVVAIVGILIVLTTLPWQP